MEVRLSQQTTLCWKQIDASACGQKSKSSLTGLLDWESQYKRKFYVGDRMQYVLSLECLGLKQRNELPIMKHTRQDTFRAILQITDGIRGVSDLELTH